MQPTPPLPPTPPDPVLPELPGAGAAAPEIGQIGGAPYVVTLPRTPEQVQGLRVRAEEIGNQLERAHDQRRELLEQLQGGPSPEGRPGLEQQLKIVDARIAQLEQARTTTENLLTGASPELLSQSQEQQRALEARRATSDDEESFFAGGASGILLTLFLLFARRRFRRRAEARRPGSAVAVAAEDPRIERLAQAVDAIAVEVERIGEGQRFVTQLLSDARPLVGERQR